MIQYLNNFMIFLDSGSNTIYMIISENRMSPICPGGPTLMGWAVTSTGTLEPTTTDSPIGFSDTFYKMSQVPNNALNIKLRNPSGITMDASGSFYVTAASGQQIVKITLNPITGVYIPTIISGFGSDMVARTLSTDIYAKYASLNTPTTIQIYNNTLYFLENNANIRNIKFDVTTTFPLNTTLPYGPLLYIANNTKNTYNTSASGGTNQEVGILENIQSNFVCCSSTGTVYLGNNYPAPGTYTAALQTVISNYVITSVNLAGVNGNWDGDADDLFSTADPYFTINNAAGSAVYTSGTVTNQTSASYANVNFTLSNPPYTITFWDSDDITQDDNLGTSSFNIGVGSQSYNSGNGTSGTINIALSEVTNISASTSVSVFPQPDALVSVTGNVISCPNDTMPTYFWYYDGVLISGES